MGFRWFVATAVTTALTLLSDPSQSSESAAWKAGPLERKAAVRYSAVTFNHDGSRFLTLSGPAQLMKDVAPDPSQGAAAWIDQHDTSTGALIRTITEPRGWASVELALVQEAQVLYGLTQTENPQLPKSRLRLVDLKTGKRRDSRGLNGSVQQVAASRDGKTAVVLLNLGAPREIKFEVQVWDLPELVLRRSLLTTDCFVLSLGISFDGKNAAAGVYARDGGAYRLETTIWDPAAGAVRRAIRGEPLQSWSVLAFSPDSKSIVVAGRTDIGGVEHEALVIRSLDTGNTVRSVPLPGDSAWTAAFSPDGKYLASASAVLGGNPARPREGILTIWNVVTGAQVHHTVEKDFAMRSIAFSPDSVRLAVAGHTLSEEVPVGGLRRLYTLVRGK